LTADPGRPAAADLDRSIARLLTYGTYVSVALLAAGLLILFARRISPLGGGPPFQPELVLDDILHARPAGFFWLGLLLVIATPSARVAASLIGYIRGGERAMAIVAVLILAVIGLSVALARGLDA
jgi:uncharacterized membrane protein